MPKEMLSKDVEDLKIIIGKAKQNWLYLKE